MPANSKAAWAPLHSVREMEKEEEEEDGTFQLGHSLISFPGPPRVFKGKKCRTKKNRRNNKKKEDLFFSGFFFWEIRGVFFATKKIVEATKRRKNRRRRNEKKGIVWQQSFLDVCVSPPLSPPKFIFFSTLFLFSEIHFLHFPGLFSSHLLPPYFRRRRTKKSRKIK